MDMEIQHLSSSTQQPPIPVTPGHLSTEMTGFSDPSHYHIQCMLGEEKHRLGATSNDEWPTSLTS
ncbi:hypothetical protein [Grimontia marina]|uniref:Uncharacterized protein n=1 Tax=Grimontia marina TaxID=646534 RepID=A0A128F272_9GAMM|nr:hypothetical protein [Grimontia marina]CZF80381.1 hypothetical protein GMA8713_01350 [Grimontia marina]